VPRDEADVSTEQPEEEERSRIFGPHEHDRRTEGDQAKTTERPETPRCLKVESYHPQERIRNKSDFAKLYKRGRCDRGKYFNLIHSPNQLEHSRMAVVASRKVGNAVQRNRIRRRAKELFRRNKDLLASPRDLLLIVKKDCRDASWADMRRRYLDALRAIGEDD
jgi:ribonuclease P protein component